MDPGTIAGPGRSIGIARRPATRPHLLAGWSLARARTDTPAVLAFLAAHAALWTLFAASQYASPPGDNLEQLGWAHSLEWGYYKHPPLPIWLLHAMLRTGIDGVWLTYASGQSCVAIGLFLIWRTCLQLTDRRSAFAALLAGSTIYYFSARGHYYNHNIAMLPFVGALTLAFVHIVKRVELRWFAVLGMAAGLGTLVKYQMLLYVLVVVPAFATLGTWRQPGFFAGSLLASMSALAIVAPHLRWLVIHDFPTVHYASGSLGAWLPLAQRPMTTLSFLAQQLWRLFPAAPALWLALRWPGKAQAARGAADETRPLVLWLSAAPLICVALLGLGLGVRLQNHWGTTLVLPTVLAIGWWLSRRAARPRRLAVLGAVLAVHAMTAGVLLAQMHRADGRNYSVYPSQRLADAALRLWRNHAASAGPPVVIGPDFDAGALAARLPGRPMVLTDGVPAAAPWVRGERVLRCGAMVVRPPERLAGSPCRGGWRSGSRTVA